jgi:ABC-2 type transport system ATP-binding protein
MIEIQDLRYEHSPGRGVRGLGMRVEPGARFGFLGPNGAGKTTTLRVLLGFLRAQAGTATIRGLDCWAQSSAIKHITAYLAGDLRVHPTLSAHQGLAMLSQLHGRNLTKQGLALCERLGLEPGLSARAMSRGTRQKLGLVLTLAPCSPLLVLDEPTTALDPLVQAELLDYLRERTALGDTVLLSSHTLSEVESFCDSVLLVRDGQVVANTTVHDLRQRAQRRVRLTFATEEAASVASPPVVLALTNRSATTWEGDLVGEVTALLRWAAPLELLDCEIAAPDLERVFRSFYTVAHPSQLAAPPRDHAPTPESPPPESPPPEALSTAPVVRGPQR